MSNIEWTEHTINPLPGCSEVSTGCMICYARRDAWRMSHNPKIADKYCDLVVKVDNTLRWAGRVNHWPADYKKLDKFKPGSRVFVNSMGDIFHPAVKPEWREQLFDEIRSRPHLFCMALTKREIPPMDAIDNLALGVTAETQGFERTRTRNLVENYPGFKFVSHEPLLAPIHEWVEGVDLRIFGGETGPGYRHHAELRLADIPQLNLHWFNWVHGGLLHCRLKGANFFFKHAPGRKPVPEQWKYLEIRDDFLPEKFQEALCH